MISGKLIEEELTYKLIGVLYKVHNKLGPLHHERHYQRAIEKELKNQNFKFEREIPVEILYENDRIGEYRIDFLIDNKVILETKAINKVHPKFLDQVLSYMGQLEIRVGLIANFKSDRLYLKRLLLAEKYLKKESV